ncbi:MAG: hypothetical protein K9L59_01870 [Desulfobacterales bacterium]|nr:hypothetical protein [Desulfobacterales bacterium]
MDIDWALGSRSAVDRLGGHFEPPAGPLPGLWAKNTGFAVFSYFEVRALVENKQVFARFFPGIVKLPEPLPRRREFVRVHSLFMFRATRRFDKNRGSDFRMP